MKTKMVLCSIAAGVMASALLFAGPAAPGDAGGAGCGGACLAATQPATQPVGTLSDTDNAALVYMREEEKLAHDVYVALAKKFPLKPFQNIPRSEKQHQSAVAGLMMRYDVPDPVSEMPDGKFATDAMQKLYDHLVEKGSASEIAALQVGAEIEELDIKDLRTRAEATDQADLKAVFAALETASGHHLHAFMRNLQVRNATYAAQHLSQPEFDMLLTPPAPAPASDAVPSPRARPGRHGQGKAP